MRHFLALLTLVFVAGCAHGWAPGPGVDPASFDQTKAKCDYIARHGGGSFFAAGNQNFVAGAALGNAVGGAARTGKDFDDCMLASGWKIASKQAAYRPPPPTPIVQPAIAAPVPTPGSTLPDIAINCGESAINFSGATYHCWKLPQENGGSQTGVFQRYNLLGETGEGYYLSLQLFQAVNTPAFINAITASDAPSNIEPRLHNYNPVTREGNSWSGVRKIGPATVMTFHDPGNRNCAALYEVGPPKNAGYAYQLRGVFCTTGAMSDNLFSALLARISFSTPTNIESDGNSLSDNFLNSIVSTNGFRSTATPVPQLQPSEFFVCHFQDGSSVRLAPDRCAQYGGVSAQAAPTPVTNHIVPTNPTGGIYCFDKRSEKFVKSSNPCGPQ